MKIKLNELLMSSEALNQIAIIDLPVKVSYAISKNTKKIAEEFKIYNETLDKIKKTIREEIFEKDKKGEFVIKDTGRKNKQGEEIKEYVFKKDFTNKDWDEKLNTALKHLEETEIEIDIHKFKVSDLGDMKIKSSILAPLWYMIDENEEKKEE